MSPGLTAAIQAAADADHARQAVCSRCGNPGEPYEYRGVRFDGLTANRGERLCPGCNDQAMAETPLLITEIDHGVARSWDINPGTQTAETAPPARCIAAAYRFADYVQPKRRKKS